MNHLNYVYRKNDNVVLRQIRDTFFLIDITENYADNTCTLYEINETGSFIWKQIDGIKHNDEIVDLLMNAIGDSINYENVRRDTEEFLSALETCSFLERI